LAAEEKTSDSRLLETIIQKEFPEGQASCGQLAAAAYKEAKLAINQSLAKKPAVQKWLLKRLQEIRPEKRTYHQKVEEG
ncbi:heptaprenyl diphosphate synthase, partial [Bacillus licheniformis]|nr:heptaprenyl diphosphate synthase [Bacillus licheniformis]